MSTHLLTFAQACERLHVSDKTLRAVIARGELRAGKLGATWRIRSDDLDAYMEALTFGRFSNHERAYRAMIAAAPPPAKAQAEGEG